MSRVWAEAGRLIEKEFEQIVDRLREIRPDMAASYGHSANEAFPFWAYLSLGDSSGQSVEHVVVSISFKHVDGRLAVASDISMADGRVISDGPTVVENLTDTRDEWVEVQTAAALTFVRSNFDTIRVLLDD